MNALAYTIIGILGCTMVAFGFFANLGIRNLEDKVHRMIDNLWHLTDETANQLGAEIDMIRLNQTVSEISTARNATRKPAPAKKAAPAVATGRSASKVEAKKAVKKAVAKKAPAKKAAAK